MKTKKKKVKTPAVIKIAAEDPRIGLVVGDRYRITELLAEGGMGVVYKGERVSLGRPVAIKFLLTQFAQDKQVLARLEREAMAMSQLSHPNCISVIDFGVEGAPYIVMDYVSGHTLRSLLDEGPVAIGRTLHITKQLLAALAHAHKQGIIHRDIKPGNVMLSEATGMGDHVRIFDFGLAMLLAAKSDSEVSDANYALGTPAFMSPEQTVGTKVDHRSDIYSTGLILFELLTGRKPFFDDDALKLMKMQRETPPPRLAAASTDRTFSIALEEVLAKALAKDPEARFQTAKEFADALMTVPENQLSKQLDEHMPPSAVISLPASQSLPAASTKNPLLAILQEQARKPRTIAVGIAVALLSLAAWFLFREPGNKVQSVEPMPDFEMVASPASPTEDTEQDNKGMARQSIIAAALELLQGKEYDEAISLLRKLQQIDPENAQYPYTLGRIYFEKKWHKDSLEQYRIAIRMDPSLRDQQTMNEHFISMLSSKKSWDTLRQVFVREVGAPALPYLQRAAKTDPDERIRKRASIIAAEISALE
ncbi:MAG: protein kinase [Myxococcota bacterium]|jgi:serine/threonine-protein kinase|nr:protein kinase [Myxococcota bacterium]